MKISAATNLILPLFILFISYSGYGQKNKAVEIDSMMRRANRLGVFNGNVLVVDHNKVIYRSSIGKADAGGKAMLTADYRFHIGSIAKEFKSIGIMSGRQVIDRYMELKMARNAEYGFDNESVLNSIGYYYLGKGRFEDAIAVFDYNTKLFPSSGNVFDSLGEAYYKKGDKPNALQNYKRSLDLDPGNTTAQRIINELSK